MTAPIVPVIPPNESGTLQYVYCSDEDIAVRAGGDFSLLCPKWQKLAYGADGVFQASDPWTLTSGTAAFDQAGFGPGYIVLLTQPRTRFKGSGELFGVALPPAPQAITLRRLIATPQGMPPGLPGSTLPSVEFTVLTMMPQIEAATFWCNQTYGIFPQTAGRRPTDADDLRDLKDFVVLTVICRRLVAEVQDKFNASWGLKLQHYQNELSAVTSRIQLRWAPPGAVPPPSTFFSMSVSR